MLAQGLVTELKMSQEFFNRSTRCIEEKQAAFAPAEGMMTAAAQIAHTAKTIDWFIDGARRNGAFDTDFEAQTAETAKVKSVSEARAWLGRAFTAAIEYIGSLSDDELRQPFPPGPIMGGAPRLAIVSGIVEHTAHHRGALTVYSRLCGLIPPMPYMET